MIQVMLFTPATRQIRALVNSLALCSILVSGGCVPTKTDRADLKKLEDAAGKGDLTAVEEELKKGFDANLLKPKDGEYENVDFAPLHFAAFNGHNEIVRLLIDRGVNVNLNIHPRRSFPDPQDKRYIPNVYQTPLISSILGDRVDTAKLLIDKGADVNRSFQYDAANRPILPPLTIASGRGNLELLKLLIQSGAKVDPPGSELNDNDRPLAAAIFYGKVEVVKFLLENGAQINFLDSDRAKERGLDEVARLLQKRYQETDTLERYKRLERRLNR